MSPRPPYDPYAPPQANGGVSPGGGGARERSFTPPGDWLKWVYAALAMAVAFIGLMVKARHGEDGQRAMEALVAQGLLGVCEIVVGLFWVYVAWADVPREHRGT